MFLDSDSYFIHNMEKDFREGSRQLLLKNLYVVLIL